MIETLSRVAPAERSAGATRLNGAFQPWLQMILFLRLPARRVLPMRCDCCSKCSKRGGRFISRSARRQVKSFVSNWVKTLSLDDFTPRQLLPEASDEQLERLHYYHHRDFRAGMASGSFLTGGMVVCPCSMGTVAAIAHGVSENLIHRAADVHLKERRKLVLVPRETPLGLIQLRNLATVAEAGAVVLPAMPAFYTKPQSIQDMIDFIVGRICDQLSVPHQLLKRWSEAGE